MRLPLYDAVCATSYITHPLYIPLRTPFRNSLENVCDDERYVHSSDTSPYNMTKTGQGMKGWLDERTTRYRIVCNDDADVETRRTVTRKKSIETRKVGQGLGHYVFRFRL